MQELGGQHPAVAGLAQMGFSVPSAYLAVAIYGNRKDQNEACSSHTVLTAAGAPCGADTDTTWAQVHDFCRNYQQLSDMGFDPVHIVGALKRAGNDAAAAIDMLG